MLTRESSDRAARALQFEDEMLPHLADVLRYAGFLGRDRSAGEDLAQETYLHAFRAWHTFQPGSDARRWLFAICRNCFFAEQRKPQRAIEYHDEPSLDAVASARLHNGAQESGCGRMFDTLDLGAAITSAMSELPETQRIVVALVDVEGLSYHETAATLGIAIGTVRSRLFRARRVLQEQLIEYARDAGFGVTPSEGTHQ